MAANREFQRRSQDDLLRLMRGEGESLSLLTEPVRLALPTPFVYPNSGPVVVFLVSDGTVVRLSEGGYLLKFLEGQGMDMSVDMVISKTVFHALQETPGAGIGGGQIYLDTSVERASEDLARFLQVLLEVIGLRHSKYKDALVQLSRAGEVQAPRESGTFWDGS